MPSLIILESTLKDRLFRLIQEELGEGWFLNQLDDTTNDPLFKTEIRQIINRKTPKYKLSPEGLVVESGLGLWVELFSPRVYKLARGVPIKAFTARPAQIKRADIYTRLLAIKHFRNQLVHSRLPLTIDKLTNNTLDTVALNYTMLVDLLHWMGESSVVSLEEMAGDIQLIRNSLPPHQ